MLSRDGSEVTSKISIAQVTASFYENLCYSSRAFQMIDSTEAVPTFAMDDFQTSLRKLKNSKAGDTGGVVAEMLKNGGQSVHTAVLDLFNDILRPTAASPETWKRTRLTVRDI